MCEIMERLLSETKEESIDLVNKLNSILIDMDRLDDLKRSAKDKAYQMQLMVELIPDEM